MVIWNGKVPVVCWQGRSVAFRSEKEDKSSRNIL